MNNAIVLANDWQSMKEQADVLVKSGLLPSAINTLEKAIVVMMQGRELGIGAMQALSGINVIQGKPTVSPQLMLALIHRSRELEDIRIEDNGSACAVTMKRIGKTPHTEVFSMSDATSMNLSAKDNWKKQPSVMRKWRAISACARVVFPDVIVGMYTTEEINPDVTIDAETGELFTGYTTAPQLPETAEKGTPGAPHGEEPHWTVTQNWGKFWKFVKNNLRLTEDEAHEALEVSSVKDFAGSKMEAMNLLEEYANEKMAAQRTQQPEETVDELHEEMEADKQSTLETFFGADSTEDAIEAIRGR